MFAQVRASADEERAGLPGDGLVPDADVVMDRAFTVPGTPEVVWPWLVQLGKRRAGWYLTRAVERLVPPSRRAARRLEPRWQELAVGDVVPDWGGADATFTLAEREAPHHLVYTSTRGHTSLSWAIVLTSYAGTSTRVHLRLRLAPVRHRRLASLLGGFLDELTVLGMAAGLRERLDGQGS